MCEEKLSTDAPARARRTRRTAVHARSAEGYAMGDSAHMAHVDCNGTPINESGVTWRQGQRPAAP